MANKRRKGGKVGRPPKIIVSSDGIKSPATIKFIRKCGSCNQTIGNNEGTLSWETMDFCDKACLEKFQNKIGANCTNCNSSVKPIRLGKLCVRIGYKISQFCSPACLNEYRTQAKVCAKCHKDITREKGSIFADMGGDEYKDFCTEICKMKYVTNANQERLTNSSCSTCKRQTIAFELEHGDKVILFCGGVCYNNYKFSHNIVASACKSCQKHFENKVLEENSMYYNGDTCSFCSPACKNRYINIEKKIVQCEKCKIQKYSFDLILLNDAKPPIMTCSLKCLNSYEAALSSESSTPMSNVGSQATGPSPTKSLAESTTTKSSTSTPITELASSLALKIPNLPGPPRNVATMCKVKVATAETGTGMQSMTSIGIQQEIETCSKEVQTDPQGPTSVLPIPMPMLVPLPMMMYSAPFPVPFPFPVPLPVPIFIPTSRRSYKGVTKRIKKILDRSIKDPLQDEMLMLAEMVSKDAKEGGASTSETDTDSEPEKKPVKRVAKVNRRGKRVSFDGVNSRPPPRRARFSKQNVSYVDYDNETAEYLQRDPRRPNNKRVSFNNDVENNIDRKPVKNRRVMFAEDQQDGEMVSPYASLNRRMSDETSDGLDNHIQPYEEDGYPPPYKEPQRIPNRMNNFNEKPFQKRRQSVPGRGSGQRKRGGGGGTVNNFPKQSMSPVPYSPAPPPSHTPSPVPPKPLPPMHELFKKPDNEMHLKYSIGVSAWQQWSQTKHPDRFNPDILMLNSEDLDTSLCLFINEVQKPNGQIYTPDTILYFCLGIQQHLFLNGRLDNIFYSPTYRRFTDSLDEITKKFLVLYNDSDFIVTRIEEEHLWESKQLGAHSPQVLLNTLLFFNTKYFNLTMVEEHKSLWFSHIVKNAKYTTNKDSGRTRSVVLRYYPGGKEPQPVQGKVRRKKGFEQYENEENPLRCPIRLYEFYISKCPDNIKGANECFYLQPESSCLPESSVWYSILPVPDHDIDKVLNRFKIVREVTMALLNK